MSALGRSFSLVLVMASAGCFGFGSGGSDASEELRECSGDASSAEVDDNVRITVEYAASLHEMVACGGLNVSLCNGVIEGILDAIIEQRPDATPPGWTYQGSGTYVTMAEGATMETRFYVARDYSFAASGSLVTDDVFLIDNYLVDAVVAVDFSTGDTEIQYSAVGPLVELLGQGPNPPNPLQITLNGLSSFQAEFKALEFESDVVLDDVRDDATVQYHVVTPRLAAQALVTGEGMGYELVEASATRDELDQELVIDEWTIEFVNEGGGQLDGSSRYHVTGGRFTFSGEAVFESSTTAETTLSCG